MKNTQVIILRATLLAAWLVLLLAACGNEFIISAEAKHNSIFGPSRPDDSPRINWGDNQVVYVNPYTYELSGTISGKIDRNGYNVWFAKDLENPDIVNRHWEILPPQGAVSPYEGIISPEFLGSAALLGGTPTSSADGEVITLIFHTEKGKVTEDDVYDLGAAPYSFILNPSAFRGADFGRLLANTKTVNFRVEVPSLTNYVKHEIEKMEYGKVELIWDYHRGSIENVKQQLGAIFENATDKFLEIMQASDGNFSGFTNANFPGSGTSEFSVAKAVWVSPPNLSKGYWLGTGTLRLGAINAAPDDGEADSDPVQISVQLDLRSDVGDAIAAIKEAEAAGSFSNIPSANGSVIVWDNVSTAINNNGITVTEKSSPPLTAKIKRGSYKVDIAVASGEGAPGGMVSIEVIVP